jgi:hypothetical protein
MSPCSVILVAQSVPLNQKFVCACIHIYHKSSIKSTVPDLEKANALNQVRYDFRENVLYTLAKMPCVDMALFKLDKIPVDTPLSNRQSLLFDRYLQFKPVDWTNT